MPGMFELQEPLRKQLEAWSVRDALCVIRSYGKRDTLGVPPDVDYYSSFQGPGIFLEDLFVRPGFRGKSVGRALLARLAQIVEEANGFGIMFNVLDWNDGAIEFYRKIGATFLDDWRTVCLKQKALHDLAKEV